MRCVTQLIWAWKWSGQIVIYIGKIDVKAEENASRVGAYVSIDRMDLEKWLVFSKKSREYGDFTYISSDYAEKMGNQEFYLWFRVPMEFQDGICADRADAFVVGLVFYAMAVGTDIKCEMPVSDELLFNLNHILLPMMANIEKTARIRIVADGIKPVTPVQRYVGTGMSCGVDSLQTLHEFGEESLPEGFRLTHLTYFNVGADRWYLKPDQSAAELRTAMEKVDEIRNEKIEIAREIAAEKKMGFLTVDSNISDLYCGCFEESHIYRSCAAIMVVQGCFARYYLSSTGCPLDDYQPKLRIDPGHYEQMLLPCLCTGSLNFINSGKSYTRLQKTEQIQDDPVAQRYLNVCSEKIPCYHCRKDFRTIISMEILECGKKFPNFYDAKRVKKIRWHAYLWLLKDRREVVVRDLWEAVQGTGLIPIKSYLAYAVWSVLHILHLKK